ncbi:MAG: response regulator transcription factor [Acidimicrobiales bacterium]
MEPAAPVRIVVIDDHAVLLESLASSLGGRDGIEVVATMHSLAEFLECSGDAAPFDVVVADCDLGDGLGTDIVPQAAAAGAVVLVLSGWSQALVAATAAQTGCAGFVHKGSPLAELERAIRTVFDGGTVFAADAIAALTSVTDQARPELTEREFDILRLLAGGRAAKEISETLFTSIHTTRSHIRSILTKLEATSQLETVVKAVQLGLIEIPERRTLS